MNYKKTQLSESRKTIHEQNEKFDKETEIIKNKILVQPGWLSGLALPSAQGVILESQDRVPCQAPWMEPTSPSACVSVSLSLCLLWINKIFKKIMEVPEMAVLEKYWETCAQNISRFDENYKPIDKDSSKPQTR